VSSRRPLDDLYFEWLYGQVCLVKEKRTAFTYWKLLRILYTKEFIWIIANDDNRAEDGRDLRQEFVEESDIHVSDKNWMRLGCSFLEMLIGLSRRLAFEAEGEPRDWFWHVMTNINLHTYTDNKLVPEVQINEILDAVIWRTYHHDGLGGLFPLRRPGEDQRDVEIWYQLSAYLLEMD
jgi:hypothetical protein